LTRKVFDFAATPSFRQNIVEHLIGQLNRDWMSKIASSSMPFQSHQMSV